MNKITNVAFSMVAICIAIQFVPYSRNHTNPPIVHEPTWNNQKTRDLAKQACFNCHSNETVWPWYSKIAPISWLVFSDVTEARQKLNISDWTYGKREGENSNKIRRDIETGEMPPIQYRLAHPEAKLDDSGRRALADGLEVTVKASIKP